LKVLLDECLPADFRHHVTGHDAFTAVYMGWTGIGNGKLLALAAAHGFDVVVTSDKNTEFQINPATMPVAVVILDVPSNTMADLLPFVPGLLSALANLKPRAFTHVTRRP
jgi:hypothetical protein